MRLPQPRHYKYADLLSDISTHIATLRHANACDGEPGLFVGEVPPRDRLTGRRCAQVERALCWA